MAPPPSKSIDIRKAPTARSGVVDTNEDGDAHVFDKWSGTLGGVLEDGSGCEGSVSQLPQVESGRADACVNAAGTVPRLYWATAWGLRSLSAVRVRLDVI